MSSERSKRDVTGIVVVDKPKGLSSNAVLQRAKRIFRARKAGHGGSLDPLASGVLPLFFGSATRLSTYALDAPKQYRVEAKLGERTTTGDAEGPVIERMPVPMLDARSLDALLQSRFCGALMQVPPMYSALKKDGKPLYALARQGIEVERAARPIQIYAIELLDLDTATMKLQVTCSKGTYIRTLVEDIGAALGCGAHITALRRTQAGAFTLVDALTLGELEDRASKGDIALDTSLLPPARGVADLPTLTIESTEIAALLHGRAIPGRGHKGEVAVFDGAGNLLSIGECDEGGWLHPRRNFQVPLSDSESSLVTQQKRM